MGGGAADGVERHRRREGSARETAEGQGKRDRRMNAMRWNCMREARLPSYDSARQRMGKGSEGAESNSTPRPPLPCLLAPPSLFPLCTHMHANSPSPPCSMGPGLATAYSGIGLKYPPPHTHTLLYSHPGEEPALPGARLPQQARPAHRAAPRQGGGAVPGLHQSAAQRLPGVCVCVCVL